MHPPLFKTQKALRRFRRKEVIVAELASNLASKGMTFVMHDKTFTHLTINKRVSFWPGSRLWINFVTGERGEGMESLYNHLQVQVCPLADYENPLPPRDLFNKS